MQVAIDKLKELPSDLSADQYAEAILKLVAEDYHEEVQELIKFDPTVEATGERPDEEMEEPTVGGVHYAILLDASGSMNAQNKGGTRMEEAKSAIMGFVDVLPKESTVSLRVYGHEGTGSDADKKHSCASTETLYNGANDANEVKSALDKVKPAGWTPIGNAIAETRDDIPEDASSDIVSVVSDGIETCDGDPVKEAKKLAAEGIEPIVNIIGFQVDNEAQQLLKEVAEAGNGEFTLANSKQDVEKYWKEEYQRLMDAWSEWRNESLKEVQDKQQELLKEAQGLGQSIMDKSQTEFQRAEPFPRRGSRRNTILSPMFGAFYMNGNNKFGDTAMIPEMKNGEKHMMEVIKSGKKFTMKGTINGRNIIINSKDMHTISKNNKVINQIVNIM